MGCTAIHERLRQRLLDSHNDLDCSDSFDSVPLSLDWVTDCPRCVSLTIKRWVQLVLGICATRSSYSSPFSRCPLRPCHRLLHCALCALCHILRFALFIIYASNVLIWTVSQVCTHAHTPNPSLSFSANPFPIPDAINFCFDSSTVTRDSKCV